MARDRNEIHSKSIKVLNSYQPIYPYTSTRKMVIQIDWPFYLTPRLAKIIGMLLHNCKITKDFSAVIVLNYSKYFEFEQHLDELLYKELGIHLCLNARHWNNVFKNQKPTINGKVFSNTFVDILQTSILELKLGYETIPNIILESPLNVKKAFITGYLRCCKSQWVKNSKYTIAAEFTPRVPQIIPHLIKILKELEITALVNKSHTSLITDLGIDLETRYAKSQGK